MGPFLLKRIATFIATLLAASLLVFAVLEILPGMLPRCGSATPHRLSNSPR